MSKSKRWDYKFMDSVLCAAGAHNMKFYFNEDEYGILPDNVRDTLKVILTGYCSDVGGIIILNFGDDGRLYIETVDPIDEIGSELLVGRIRRNYEELFIKLEKFRNGLLKLKSKEV